MQIATFGEKTFEVSSNAVYTFDDFETSQAVQVEEQDNIGAKPSTFIKGIGLKKIKFNIYLNQSLGADVYNEIADWEDILDSRDPQMFSINGNYISDNKFLLESVDVSNVIIAQSGLFTKAILKISISEFASASAESKAQIKEDKQNARNALRQSERQAKADAKAAEKEKKKRENTSAKAALKKGPKKTKEAKEKGSGGLGDAVMRSLIFGS